MQKIISIIIITIALTSCGTEDLREANLRILTLKKQLPQYQKYKDNEAKYNTLIQEPSIDSVLRTYITPKDKFFDTLQYIKLTLFQPLSDRFFIFKINRQDYNITSYSKIINGLELSKKLGDVPSQTVIADTSNKIVKKLAYRKLMNILSTMTMNDASSDIEDDPKGHSMRYNYDLEILSIHKDREHHYTSIKKHHHENDCLTAFLNQFFQIVDVQKLDGSEKMMLDKKLLQNGK